MLLTTLVALALASSPYRPVGASKPASVCSGERKLAVEGSKTKGVANLPFAMGKSFVTLDNYLDYLECFAQPIDKPWWKQVRPGVYEHVTTATNAKPEVATRAELMKRFGFTR